MPALIYQNDANRLTKYISGFHRTESRRKQRDCPGPACVWARGALSPFPLSGRVGQIDRRDSTTAGSWACDQSATCHKQAVLARMRSDIHELRRATILVR